MCLLGLACVRMNKSCCVTCTACKNIQRLTQGNVTSVPRFAPETLSYVMLHKLFLMSTSNTLWVSISNVLCYCHLCGSVNINLDEVWTHHLIQCFFFSFTTFCMKSSNLCCKPLASSQWASWCSHLKWFHLTVVPHSGSFVEFLAFLMGLGPSAVRELVHSRQPYLTTVRIHIMARTNQ